MSTPRFRSVSTVAVVALNFLLVVALIAMQKYFSIVRESLALLGSVVLELLITVAGLNFTGWLFLHASYYDKVKQAQDTEAARLRAAMRRFHEQENLTDARLDQWIDYVSVNYSWLWSLNPKLEAARSTFLFGMIVALVAGFTELFPSLPFSYIEFFALAVSASILVLGVLMANSLMKDLSKPPAR